MPIHRRPQDQMDRVNSLTPHTRLHVVMLLAQHPALIVTSGRRSPQHNRDVGGVPSSAHLVGRACDFDGPEWLLRSAAATARMQRVTPRCTGPEQVLVHATAGHGGLHLHVEW